MAAPAFDYTNGSAIVQHGVIYYLPNCTWPVVIPPHPMYSSDPFRQPRLNSTMFKQPVWWSHGWAWQSFIPLAPSFTLSPFGSLCAMPRIEEVRFSSPGHSEETCFRMNEDDTRHWMTEEEHIVKISHVIQICYGIPGSLPPKPLLFHFNHFQKSHQVVKRMICVAQDWFAIWMGFFAYLITKSATLVPSSRPDNSFPAPDWYNHLRNEHNFSEAWLDDLLVSTACSFDLGTPHAGIVFQWSEENWQRESIKLFYDHNIPLWFIWSSKEEQAILDNPSLAYLQPPNKLIQQVLTILFSILDVPLAGLILQQYFRIGKDPITNKTIEFLCLQYAPPFVFQFTAKSSSGRGILSSLYARDLHKNLLMLI